jgi:tetratricopeptide (TPR) repeat protein
MRLDDAIVFIKRALEKEPENGYYHDSLGWAFFKNGNYSEAQKSLEHAVTLVPPDSTIFEHLGDIYQALNEIEKAKDAWKRSLSIKENEALSKKLKQLEKKNNKLSINNVLQK